MVEAAANSQEYYLIDGLSFKLKPGASYINERKSVTFHPQGSNVYSPNGTKLITTHWGQLVRPLNLSRNV